ncbi:PepSY domain-containing protein [Pseudofulvimonas gallinarii]|jgi:uncharacterized membrane protein YkoI|uniref:Peptidase YpeB-like protein n=1 Tax=Pseudofulvimonas gallinarii TaxID=634155 RepID=A0A4V2UUQ1_9GAMM|nr:PepSY domain-containing protein [Pseudofulvimonas gallinarii]TCS92071.1 peptidase YpeB-like protein [Pseudofulvimonas gallinarii]THD14720.1 hypothetical protein B1808_02230 [Pseudofulvimonas gallinarii]
MDKRLIALAIVALASAMATAAPASERRDHERARAAVVAGERLPLSVILKTIEERFGGRVLEIDLEDDRGRPVYEIEILDDRGRVLELDVDAATGEILEQEYDD